MLPRQIVLATHNRGKLLECQSLLEPLGIEILPLSDFVQTGPEETGWTFVENAILKARNACRIAQLPAIADDSGLEVDALRGEPGIFSARYAGEGASDEENLFKLIEAMKSVPEALRGARYRCAVVFMRWDLDPAPLICQATWEGSIAHAPRGRGGFGYDPVFCVGSITAAEMHVVEKNTLSHRAKAFQQLVTELSNLRNRQGACG